MSAYIVNDKTINRILSFLSGWNFNRNVKLKSELVKLKLFTDSDSDLNHFGLKLKNLNAESVSQRYNEEKGKQEFEFKFEKCDIFQAYNHLRCLTYQMCEGNVPQKQLYKVLQKIEEELAFDIAHRITEEKKCEWEAK